MSQMQGADVVALRAFGEQLKRDARRMHAIESELTGAVARGAWQGRDANEFHALWSHTLRPRLATVAERLGEVATQVAQQADEQERASAAGGGPGGAGPGGGPGGAGPGGGPGGGPNASLFTWEQMKDAALTLKKAVMLPSQLGKLFDVSSLARSFMQANLLAATNTAAASAKVMISGMMREVAVGGKVLGPLGAVIGIGSGIHDMIWPAHEGARSWGDRGAGFLSVVSGGATLALIAGIGTAPILAPIALGAGVAAAAWTVGNYVYDHWDSIKEAASHPVETAKKTWNSVCDAAGKATSWVKGLFG